MDIDEGALRREIHSVSREIVEEASTSYAPKEEARPAQLGTACTCDPEHAPYNPSCRIHGQDQAPPSPLMQQMAKIASRPVLSMCGFAECEADVLAMKRRKQEFIRQLAIYLVEDQAIKSIELQMGKPSAVKWSKLRNSTNIFGYPDVEEAVETLTKFLE